MHFYSLAFSHQALIVFVCLLVASVLRSSIRRRRRSRGLPLPPGPPRLPIVGNLFNHPRTEQPLAYHELCSRYGDVLYFKILQNSILVLDSARAVNKFLHKKAANSSDRKQNPMIELSGSKLNFGFLPHGQWWRRHRRAFWQHFNGKVSIAYRPAQRDVAHQFLGKLLRDPSRLSEHIRYTSAAAILKIVYDIDTADQNDRYVAVVAAALEGPVQGLVPGAFLVDHLPLLRYIPTWFPGATSQRLFAKWQAAGETLKNLPYDHVKAALSASEEDPRSIIGRLIMQRVDASEPDVRLEEEEIVKNIGAVTFEAGSETTSITLLALFLAMAMHPEVLKKAHTELDTVVGPDRLPDFTDQESLVYVDAIVKEVFRWHPVLPLSLPHCTSDDDELDGYFIPAGTMVVPNVWACMRDPEVYDDPEDFRPERFIRDGKPDPSVRDPAAFVFGFGRRICPGRYFAQAGLFMTIASVLHVFDITASLDDQDLPIQLVHGMSDGATSLPKDYQCTVRPRSAQAEALILAHARHGSSLPGVNGV
ncbi:cytochrome P450 [Cerioporus squamosus]|nr:cytochrome P450 [Cerioporus squamosus]